MTMDSVLAWGLDIVRSVQTMANPALTFLMRLLSFLGTQYFFMAFLPVFYWCLDRRRAARLAMVFLGSVFLNLWIKDLLLQPRPYDFDPSVGMGREATPGLPSGHAQNSAVFWGLFGTFFRKPWGLVLALAFPLLIGFSRVYLGLHFPTDVFAGWAIGLLVVLGEALVGDRLARILERLNVRIRLALVALLAFAMNALDMRDSSLAGVFFGAGLGFAFVGRLAPFSAAGSFGSRLSRYLLGMAGAAAIYLIPKLILPAEAGELSNLLRFLRYGLLGTWLSLGAPWLFLRLGLAEREGD